MTKSENEGGFVSHLTELRKRLIHSFIFLFIFFIGCYFFSENLYAFLVEPFASAVKENGLERRLIFTALQETFLTYIKVAFFTAFFVTCPYILMQIWKFIAPGLYANEKGFVLPLVVFSFFSFCLGIFFSYEILIPYCLNFFAGLSGENILNNFSINHYFSFITWLLLGCGIVFQLPVISFLLSTIGVLTPAFMRHYRRHSIVAIFIVSSFITPPDPVSMVVMAFPLIILFELKSFKC